MRVLASSTLILGVLYSMQALGFVLVIRGTGVLNFAQGQMLALGAYVFLSVSARVGNFWLALVLMPLIMAAVGYVLYRVLLRRFEGSPLWALVTALFGLSVILDSIIQIAWGPGLQFIENPFSSDPVILPGGFISDRLALVMTAVSAGWVVGLLALIYITPLGLRMRASAENRALAGYSGLNVRAIAGQSWILASTTVAIAGLALGLQQTTFSPALSDSFLTAFPAVVLGGFESIAGAVIAAFVLAAILQTSVTLVNSSVALPIAYTVLLAVLMVRPQGLFGARDIVRI